MRDRITSGSRRTGWRAGRCGGQPLLAPTELLCHPTCNSSNELWSSYRKQAARMMLCFSNSRILQVSCICQAFFRSHLCGAFRGANSPLWRHFRRFDEGWSVPNIPIYLLQYSRCSRRGVHLRSLRWRSGSLQIARSCHNTRWHLGRRILRCYR